MLESGSTRKIENAKLGTINLFCVQRLPLVGDQGKSVTLVRDYDTRLRARVFFTANAIINLQARLNSISRACTTVTDIQDSEPQSHYL